SRATWRGASRGRCSRSMPVSPQGEPARWRAARAPAPSSSRVPGGRHDRGSAMRLLQRLLLGLAMSAPGMSGAIAADDPAALYTATYVEVAPPSTAQAVTLLRQSRQAAAASAGALRIEVLQRIDRPNQFVVLAAWKDQKAFEGSPSAAPLREA